MKTFPGGRLQPAGDWLAGLIGLLAGAAIALESATALAAGDWTPPIGIPAPAFGIAEVAPATPAPWTAATPGFYYVDQNHPGATDSSNPYGTPAKPRRTIPATEAVPLPAGSVVEVHGRYDMAHSSPNDFHALGSAAAPVFVRGVSAAAKPVFTQSLEVIGCRYVIFENLEFADQDGDLSGGACGSFAITDKNGARYDSHHIALRHSRLHGNLNGGGVGVGGYSGTSVIDNVVIYSCAIFDNGDVNAAYDQDVHGIAVGGNTHHVWVVDNQLARNSGDGLQINGFPLADPGLLHHIYVGRNLSHQNKQSGLWTKTAADVIFSQNVCFGHRPGNSSMGAGMGFQYSPERVWFLFNHIYDCEYGIASGSDKSPVYGRDIMVIGNVIHDIHTSDGHSPAAGGWGDAAISLVGGTNRYVVGNTIYDVDAGINSPTIGNYLIENNIISTLTHADGNHLFLEADWSLTLGLRNNIFYQGGAPARIRIGVTVYTLPQAQTLLAVGQDCVTADPLMVDPAGDDFRLQAASPAIDGGAIFSDVYAAFEAWYPGQSIRKDAWSQSRPQGSAWDIGAYEFPDFLPGPTLNLPASLTLPAYAEDAAATSAAVGLSFTGATGGETWTATVGTGAFFSIIGGSGTGNGSFTVAALAGLPEGSYAGVVVVTSSGAVNSPVSVPVTLTVLPAGTPTPPPPGGAAGRRKKSGCAISASSNGETWLWLLMAAIASIAAAAVPRLHLRHAESAAKSVAD